MKAQCKKLFRLLKQLDKIFPKAKSLCSYKKEQHANEATDNIYSNEVDPQPETKS